MNSSCDHWLTHYYFFFFFYLFWAQYSEFFARTLLPMWPLINLYNHLCANMPNLEIPAVDSLRRKKNVRYIKIKSKSKIKWNWYKYKNILKAHFYYWGPHSTPRSYHHYSYCTSLPKLQPILDGEKSSMEMK